MGRGGATKVTKKGKVTKIKWMSAISHDEIKSLGTGEPCGENWVVAPSKCWEVFLVEKRAALLVLCIKPLWRATSECSQADREGGWGRTVQICRAVASNTLHPDLPSFPQSEKQVLKVCSTQCLFGSLFCLASSWSLPFAVPSPSLLLSFLSSSNLPTICWTSFMEKILALCFGEWKPLLLESLQSSWDRQDAYRGLEWRLIIMPIADILTHLIHQGTCWNVFCLKTQGSSMCNGQVVWGIDN